MMSQTAASAKAFSIRLNWPVENRRAISVISIGCPFIMLLE
jgi:hypothetical protein